MCCNAGMHESPYAQVKPLSTTSERAAPLCYSDDPAERRELAAMFDSTDLLDHMTAAELCAECPVRAGCLQLAEDIAQHSRWAGAPNGTWGGELWRDGRLATYGTGRKRRAS